MVNLLDLYPLYLMSFWKPPTRRSLPIMKASRRIRTIEDIFHNRLLEAYNYYLIIGGMPNALYPGVNHKDPAAVSRIQRDWWKFTKTTFPSITGSEQRAHPDGVPQHCLPSSPNPMKSLSTALSGRAAGRGTLKKPSNGLSQPVWLNRIYNVSKMEHPLSAFDKLDQFKLFLFDTGLLKHMAE